VVELSGANDGLNTIVPYTNDAYYRARPKLGLRPEKLRQLALAQIDVVRGVMDPGRQAEICTSVESVVADLSDHVDVADEEIAQAAPLVESPVPIERSSSGAALCLAGRTPIDPFATPSANDRYYARVARGLEHAQRPVTRRSDQFLVIFRVSHWHRRGDMQDIPCANGRLTPARV
jgi:uncharacterized protein (DUF1501 family)